MSAAPPDEPLFSVVTAVYGVVDYLPAFIETLEAQDIDPRLLEVVAVDDGSIDGSLDVLERWRDRAGGRVRVVTKENGGQGSARNLGIEHTRGTWITFTDPDDLLDPDYFSRVAAFVAEHPDAEMIATARWMLDDTSGELSDTHPLAAHFRQGDRLIDLDEYQDKFHGSAPAAFFRRDRLESTGTRFDDRVQPNFEDGHFCTRYLLACPRPLVGFVASARYHYRKRASNTSTLQTSLSHPGRYTDVLRWGYLDVLRQSVGSDGRPAEWVQSFVMYELSWYFSAEERHAGSAGAAVAEVADEHHALMAEIAGLLSPEVVEGFKLRHFARTWRYMLLHGYRDESWNSGQVTLLKHDADQDLARAVYYFVGAPPVEDVYVRGRRIDVAHRKRRDVSYHGRVLLHEEFLWIPLRWWIRVRLDGVDAELLTRPPEQVRRSLTASRVRTDLDPAELPEPGRPLIPDPEPVTLLDRVLRRWPRSRLVGRRYRDAWVLMDRIHDADDSGERLFSYLRRERPKINAWFVLEKDTPDWRRMQALGLGDRMVAHGTLRWKLLMARCRHLISSHADQPIVSPPAIRSFTRPTWRFTFLQHGVIKDDISAWLNPKPIDLFVTSTVPEHESIVGDGTNWRLTTKEVRLTGLPRFDRLLEKGESVPADRRDLVLVCPTWRNWLVPPLDAGSQRRTMMADFVETRYVREWTAFLSSPELERLCAEHGLRIGFLPHPNIQPALPLLDLPPHVEALTFSDHDVQELIARAAVMVTDYSSMAFNAAYIDRPVVYFQFDQAEILAGAHVGRAGYFEYGRDGFGPVEVDLDRAVAATCTTVDAGRAPSEPYRSRIAATFPLRDGRCCERVTDEIKRSTRRARVVWSDGAGEPG